MVSYCNAIKFMFYMGEDVLYKLKRGAVEQCVRHSCQTSEGILIKHQLHVEKLAVLETEFQSLRKSIATFATDKLKKLPAF